MMMKAPVYRGNSGSPVINAAGEVIGIVFATAKKFHMVVSVCLFL